MRERNWRSQKITWCGGEAEKKERGERKLKDENGEKKIIQTGCEAGMKERKRGKEIEERE